MSIKPNEFANPAISIDNHSGWSLNLIAPFTLSEFEKKNIRLKEMLSHYSRLTPWIPFYKETLDSITNEQLDNYYSNKFIN